MLIADLEKQITDSVKTINPTGIYVDTDIGDLEHLELVGWLETNKTDLLSNDIRNLIRLRTYKEKEDSVEALKKIISSICGVLQTKKVSVLRIWVAKLLRVHPKIDIDPNVNNSIYLQPMSEEIGGRTLGYSTDTQSLELADWSTNKAKSIRKNVELKLNPDILTMINSSYTALNERFVQNISLEFFEERKISRVGGTGSHDFHLAGDTTYPTKILDPVKPQIKTNIENFLKDSVRLINYLYPVINLKSFTDEYITVKTEEVDLNVNDKGNIYITIPLVVNNNVLKPKVGI